MRSTWLLSVPACQLYALCSKASDTPMYHSSRRAPDLENGAVPGTPSSRAINQSLHSKGRTRFNAYPNISSVDCQRRRRRNVQTLQNWENHTWREMRNLSIVLARATCRVSMLPINKILSSFWLFYFVGHVFPIKSKRDIVASRYVSIEYQYIKKIQHMILWWNTGFCKQLSL